MAPVGFIASCTFGYEVFALAYIVLIYACVALSRVQELGSLAQVPKVMEFWDHGKSSLDSLSAMFASIVYDCRKSVTSLSKVSD